MKIKAVCERTGLTDRAVRLYIENGLLTPEITENYSGRRSFDFSQDDVACLNRIAALRASGFSIAQIKQAQTDPHSIPRIVAEVAEKQEKELRSSENILSALNALPKETASFEALAERLRVEEQPSPPAEDNSMRIRYLISGFLEGNYRNGVFDGIIRAVILAGIVLFSYYAKYDKSENYLFSSGMWIDLLTVFIAAGIAAASYLLFVRDNDIVNSVVKLFLSNLTLVAAVGMMFLVWLIARIILYAERPIPNHETIHIAELWIVFIGISAALRVILLSLHFKRDGKP